MNERLNFLITEEDRELLTNAAEKDGRTISSFVRFYSLEKAREVLEDGKSL